MSGRVKLGATQQDAISLSSDSDAVSVTALSVTSEELPTIDDIVTGRFRTQRSETPDEFASQYPGSSRMSRLTQPSSTTKSTMPSTSTSKPSSTSKGKRRMVLDETLVNGKDYTPRQRRKTPKLLDGQSKLSQFLTRDPPPPGAGPSRLSKVIGKEPLRGTSRANAIDLDPTSSDDDVPVVITPRKRQVSRQPSRPPPASTSRRLFTRGRSATSFSDAPVELPSLPKGKSTSGVDDGLLDWLRVSPSLSPSVSPQAATTSRSRAGVSESPSKRLKSSTPAIKSSQPDRDADIAAHQPRDTQRARSVTRPPATPQRRTRNTFLPPPKISASGSLELVPETPPRPTDLLASLARTPTPSPAKARIDPSPIKSKAPPAKSKEPVPSKEAASPKADISAPIMKRRRAAFEELDEESYRPSPKTKLGREVRQLKKRDVSDPADVPASGRPRRVAAIPGKYKLPTMDTPIHQWPTTRGSPGASTRPRKSSSPSKLRNAVVTSTEDEEVTPRRRGRRAAAATRKTATPRSTKKKASKRTPTATRPAPPTSDSSSESSLSTPPPPEAELPQLPHTPSPEAAASVSPPPPAEPEEDLLAEFAEYADWPGSPAQSQQATQSPRNGLLRTPSRSSIGRFSASPLVKHPSLSPLASQKPQLPPSQSSQKSLTTRVLEDAKAEREARERAAEEYARLLEQRTAARIAEREAATPSDSEDELHLSQVLE